VIVGTYSSIFIASPFALWWEEVAAKRRGVAPAAAKPTSI
jgi:preprotein translocase subunit SecF